MAYKPKYAAKGRADRTVSVPQPKKDEKKPGKITLVIFILLGLFVVPASTYLTGNMLMRMVQDFGRPKEAVQSKVQGMSILASFEESVSAAMEAARTGLTAPSASSQPGSNTATPDTQSGAVEPVRKRYWIEDGVLVAPKPNQNYFGETEDPKSLQWLLDEAAWILNGQKLHFNMDVELFAGSKVRYYLDDSIFAITWKEVHEGSVYTFSEIKVSHPSQFRRHLAGGEFGSDMQYMTTEMAESVNAVVASSGDFYRFRDFGICVYQGQVRRVEGTYAETCMIDKDGNMHFVRGGEILKTDEAQKYVDENNIQFSLCFGPILVDNYEVVEHTWYGVGEIDEGYARAALCQLDELHYIVATANTEGAYQDIPTVATFNKYISATGCKMAYCLDGGQTAAIVMNNQLINRPVYGTQRKISDIIYFATAVPNGG